MILQSIQSEHDEQIKTLKTQIEEMEFLFNERMQSAQNEYERLATTNLELENQLTFQKQDHEDALKKALEHERQKLTAKESELEQIRENRDQLFEEKFKVEEVVD